MTTMNDDAARYAGLCAIEAGITAARQAASVALQDWAKLAGLSKGSLATQFGPVTLRENKGSTTVAIEDEAAFLAWCLAEFPEAVETITYEPVTRINPVNREALLTQRFVIVAGKVVDSQTGEQVEFAGIATVDPSPPTPTYGASAEQRAAKKAATDWAASRAPGLVSGLKVYAIAGDPPEFDPMAGE